MPAVMAARAAGPRAVLADALRGRTGQSPHLAAALPLPRRCCRGARDGAILTVLLHAGAREEECARLDVEDIAITARTGTIRLHGKGDEVRTIPLPKPARDRINAWLDERGRHPGPLWPGQRGPLTISGIVQVVLAAGADAGIPGLRPHRCRHTYATRLRQGGADVAQVQALLGHASLDTAARYFRAGTAETTAVVERVFDR